MSRVDTIFEMMKELEQVSMKWSEFKEYDRMWIDAKTLLLAAVIVLHGDWT